MRLYHYTAPQFVAGIKREGITWGRLPVWGGDRITLLPRYQWLTDEDKWDQPWNPRKTIKYDRTAWRVVVVVPKSERRHLFRWRDLAAKLRLPDQAVTTLNMNGEVDDSHWWVYAGLIPRLWLRTWEHRPEDPSLGSA